MRVETITLFSHPYMAAVQVIDRLGENPIVDFGVCLEDAYFDAGPEAVRITINHVMRPVHGSPLHEDAVAYPYSLEKGRIVVLQDLVPGDVLVLQDWRHLTPEDANTGIAKIAEAGGWL